MGGFSFGGMQDPELWKRLLSQLQSGGVAIDPAQSGGFNPRNIAGTNVPSQHAFGRAMDVNWRDNPQGVQPANTPQAYDMFGEDARKPSPVIHPDTARDAASRFGMRWGGDFSRPDTMHFEMARPGGSVPLSERGITSAAGLSAPQAYGGTPPATDTGTSPPPGGRGFGHNYASDPMFQSGLGGFLGTARDRMNSPGFMNYANLAFGRPLDPTASSRTQIAEQELALRQQAGSRQETEFQQQQDRIRTAQRIWGSAFPNGQPNPDHPLLKGMPEPFQRVIGSMDPQQGLPILGQYALADANARRALEMQIQKMGLVEQGLFGGGGQAAAEPQTFQRPPVGPQTQAGGQLGAVPQSAISPSVAPVSGPSAARFAAPALAPQLPSVPPELQPRGAQGPAGVAPQPTVFGMPLDQARRRAIRMDALGMRSEPFEQAIKAAEAEGKPTEAARSEGIKADQAYRSVTTALDDFKKMSAGDRFPIMAPSRSREAIAARTNIQLQLKELYNLGVLNGPDLALMERMLPDPTSGVYVAPGLNAGEQVGIAVDNLKKKLTDIRNAKTGVLGLPPVGGKQKGPEEAPGAREITVNGKRRRYRMTPTGPEWAD